MAVEPTHPQADHSSTIAPTSGPDWASRRKILLLIGGVLGPVLIYFGALTLLSSTRWLDFAPGAGTISAAPDRLATVAQLSGQQRLTQVALRPDGELVATVSADAPGVAVRAIADSSLRYTLDAGNTVLFCSFSPDSQTVVTANSDRQIKVWDADDGRMRYPPLVAQQQPLMALRITNDGQRLVSVGQDGMIVTWQLGDGRQLRVSTGKLPNLAHGTATFSEDGSVLAYSTPTTSDITIFSLDTEEVRTVINDASARTPLAALTFSHSGALLVVRDTTGKLQIFRAATGELVRTLLWTGQAGTGSAGPVQVGAFNADARLFVLGGRDGSLELWEVESGMLRARLPGGMAAINALDFSADGRGMVSAGDDGVVRVWRVR